MGQALGARLKAGNESKSPDTILPAAWSLALGEELGEDDPGIVHGLKRVSHGRSTKSVRQACFAPCLARAAPGLSRCLWRFASLPDC